jgi:aspartokinase/homoserine dehydrogenase 1
VAQFENGKQTNRIKIYSKDHPFANLEGKDNIVLFFTDRYVDQPLLIKGAWVLALLLPLQEFC